MTTLLASCPSCGEQQSFDPRSGPISLVKVPGKQIAVVFTCPKCSSTRRREVPPALVSAVAGVFRAAGRPMLFLPPQGDLPWPPLSWDDLIEWGLHTEEILEHLTMEEPDG